MTTDKKPNINTVIFDFDGTIADSFGIFVESLEEVLPQLRPLSPEEIQDLRGLSVKAIIRKLGVKNRQLPSLLVKGRRVIAKKMDQVDIFEGMAEAINQLANADYKLFILSTNAQEIIENFGLMSV